MKINDHLFVVGGGDYGFNLSNRLDSNCYIIDTGEGLWMIDAGFDGEEGVLANIKSEGLEPHDITHLFVTHYHADHAGALAAMRKSLAPELKIAIAGEVAEQVRAGDEEDNGLRWAKSFDFYPSAFDLEPCDIDIELVEGQQFTAGGFGLTSIATDGHCRGHMCFYVTGGAGGYLFSGDHVFWGGKIILQNVVDSSVQQYAASMNRLLDYDFDALLPGHLNFSMHNGRRHVQAAADQFNKIGLPQNML
jgi:hydroxyacylglutathione hydrolase